MRKKTAQWMSMPLFFIACCLFLLACTSSNGAVTEEPVNENTVEAQDIIPMDIPYDHFQKVVGWLSGDTVLVHIGDTDSHSLHVYNIFSGEMSSVYEEDSFILTVVIHQSKDKIIFQEVRGEDILLTVMDLNGEILQTAHIDYSGYTNLDWNPINDNLVFVSHYVYDEAEETEELSVNIWDIENNTFVEEPLDSASPSWYSANVYLYVDLFEGTHLYIGDIRESEPAMLINRNIHDFFLHDDTFIGMSVSDIREDQLYLFQEYPFLVSGNVIPVPKVTMNNQPLLPHMTQSTRNGKVYGVLSKEAIAIEEDVGEFQLSHLNFEDETVHNILDLPFDAPIALCPNERYILYGWRYEYIIDLESEEMLSLLKEMI